MSPRFCYQRVELGVGGELAYSFGELLGSHGVLIDSLRNTTSLLAIHSGALALAARRRAGAAPDRYWRQVGQVVRG